MKKFICSNCNKEFSKYNLQRHIEKKYKCYIKLIFDICNKEFDTYQALTRHKNNKKKCSKLDLETKYIISQQKIELLELKLQIANLIQLKNNDSKVSNITNNNNNTNNNTIIINNFGNENLDHIKISKLFNSINDISKKKYIECERKIMLYKDLRYDSHSISTIDVYNLLFDLIFLVKNENRTLKKENNKFYIKNEDWQEIVLDELTLKVFIKQQEVLVKIKSKMLLKNRDFMKIINMFFIRDDFNNYIIEVGNIEELWFSSRMKIFKKLLNYKLDSKTQDEQNINHIDNIL